MDAPAFAPVAVATPIVAAKRARLVPTGSGSLGLHVEAMTTSSSTIRGGSCR